MDSLQLVTLVLSHCVASLNSVSNCLKFKFSFFLWNAWRAEVTSARLSINFPQRMIMAKNPRSSFPEFGNDIYIILSIFTESTFSSFNNKTWPSRKVWVPIQFVKPCGSSCLHKVTKSSEITKVKETIWA